MVEGALKRQRTCIGCRKKSEKQDFARIVKTPEKNVVFDAKGRIPGRGAYVCSLDCLKNVVANGKLSKSLKTSVPSELGETLVGEYENYELQQRRASTQ